MPRLFIAFILISQCCRANNIGERSFSFVDESRHQRPVVTELWYPTTDPLKSSDSIFSPFARQYTVRDGRLPDHKLPLILLSHGTGGGRLTLEWLAQSLASHGFIVAAVDHWGNTFENKIPIEFMKPWERPLDISFALSSLMKNPNINNIIDADRIGAAGFSYGAYTVIALDGGVVNYPVLIHYFQTIGHREMEIPELPGLAKWLTDSTLLDEMHRVPLLKDKRIKAFVSISPALGAGFTDRAQLSNADRPLLIIGSQSDSMAPVRTNAFHYHAMMPKSAYFEFPGKTGHYVMLAEAIDDVKKSAPIYFTDDPSVDRKQVHEKVDQLAIDFFRSHL